MTSKRSSSLLACGVVAGPLFVALVLLQALTREGFDPRIHPLSMLSLGDAGWIQIANFLVSGVLFVLAAVGLRAALHPGRAGTWGPLLVGAFGVSLVWAGVFSTDPALGFPPGAPAGVPDASWHGALHNWAPVLGYYALFAACFVFARRFLGSGQRGWALYCLLTAVAGFILSTAGVMVGDFRVLLAGGVLTWGWASVMAWQVRSTRVPQGVPV